MFFFHEGLPGSGKSYEAVVKHLVPALAKGRPVDAYIEGLNVAKLAELADISEDRCRELLVQLTREQMPEVWKHTRDNALVFIDEMQNFWPSDKRRLSPEMTQFITEHRHRGQDICGMGQDLRDVHAMWRRRCAQKIVFSKLDGLGREGNYSVRVWKATTPEKFERINESVGKYDPKYFGAYKSHISEDTNAENYKDSRAVVWNSWGFRVGIPAFLVVVAFAGWWVYSLLWGGNLAKSARVEQPKRQESSAVAAPAAAAVQSPVLPASPPPPPAPAVVDYIQQISERWRPRLAAMMEMRGQVQGVIEWYDDAMRRQESLDFRQLEVFGYTVQVVAGVAMVRKGALELQITSWPIEPLGRLSQAQNRQVAQPL